MALTLSLLSAFLLISVSAVLASPVSQNQLQEFLNTDFSKLLDQVEDDASHPTRRALLQGSNTPRTTFTIAGSKVSVFNFRDFGGNARNFLRLDNAARIVGNKLRLVNSSPANRSGQAVLRDRIFFYNTGRGLAAIFGTKFTYQFTGRNNRNTCRTNTNRCPGEGFTFTFNRNIPSGGRAGKDLGYGGSGNISIAVEFDIVNNVPLGTGQFTGDPSDSHIGFNSKGSRLSFDKADLRNETNEGGVFDIYNEGKPATVWIEFVTMADGMVPDDVRINVPLGLFIQVYIAKGNDRQAKKPARPFFRSLANPRLILQAVGTGNDELYAGFTASNGNDGVSGIEISSWGFWSGVFGPFTE